MSPLLALGAFAVPSWRDRLVEAGVAWSDWASGIVYREGHLAPTFANAEIAPFDEFPKVTQNTRHVCARRGHWSDQGYSWYGGL